MLRLPPLLALVALVAACTGSEADRPAYIAHNREILSQLPRFPGSTTREEVSTAYRLEENEPVAGYATRVVLALPSEATVEDLVSYFRKHMGLEWRLVEALDGPVLHYRRDDAGVSINLDNWRIHQMEIAVDHAYFENRGL